MSSNRLYLTTAMPYVNADPHLGHALELLQGDILARHARARGREVRLMAGTDEHAIKNVTAARAAGEDIQAFVDRHSDRFRSLSDTLQIGLDDFIRTTEDRHVQGVEKLWALSAAKGDFYRRTYSGRYCTGCEQFVTDLELVDGVCPEHLRAPETISEDNWFFRLSAYADQIEDLIESEAVQIVPAKSKNEVLAFIRRGLEDISVSRPTERSGGWGVPVPDDPDQTIYVWWDALTNYINSPGFGTDEELYAKWWGPGADRIHLQGKGIVKFHAVYWLALLLSTGQPLPTHLYVHQYLTADGAKLSKTTGNLVDPFGLVDDFGADAVRWWLASAPRDADLDFTEDRLIAKYNAELAKGLGNTVSRIAGLVAKAGVLSADAVEPPHSVAAIEAGQAAAELPGQIDDLLEHFDIRGAGEAIVAALQPLNKFVQEAAPWTLIGDESPEAQRRLAGILTVAVSAARTIVDEATPIIPAGAGALRQLLDQPTVGATAVFPRRNAPVR